LDSIYLGNYSQLGSVSKDVNGVVTGITLTTGSTIFSYQFENETGSFLNEFQVSNGNKWFNQTVNFTLAGLDQTRMDLIETLGLAKVFAICRDKRGKAFLLGNYGGMEVSTLTSNSGAAQGDANGMTVSLMGASLEISPEVEVSIIAGLL
jgi:hypothetical protein